jgi:sn-glycerol 3-phosphate transport system permease protein
MYKTTERILKILSAIAKILIIFIFIFPFLWMVSISLQTAEEISTFPATMFPAVPQFVNYATAWAKAPFFIYLRNSIVIVGVIILVNILVMIPAAYAFAKYQFKGQKILFGLVLLAFMTPLQVTFIPVYYTMSDWGLLNTLWPQILPFLVDAFGIFLLRQYFMQVSDELIEAARLDNTSELKIIYKLMLPLSKAAVSTSVLFSFVNHWNDYFWPMVVTSVDKLRPLTVGVASLKDNESVTEWNIIFAGNMFLVVPILVAYIFCSRYIIRAFAYNGVK